MVKKKTKRKYTRKPKLDTVKMHYTPEAAQGMDVPTGNGIPFAGADGYSITELRRIVSLGRVTTITFDNRFSSTNTNNS